MGRTCGSNTVGAVVNVAEREKRKRNSTIEAIEKGIKGADQEKKTKQHVKKETISATSHVAEREKRKRNSKTEATDPGLSGEDREKKRKESFKTETATLSGAEREKSDRNHKDTIDTMKIAEDRVKKRAKSNKGTIDTGPNETKREKKGKKNIETTSIGVGQDGAEGKKKTKRSKTAIADVGHSGVECGAERNGNSQTEIIDAGLNGAEREKKRSKNRTQDTPPLHEAKKGRSRKEGVKSVSPPEKRNWKTDRESPELRGGRYTGEETGKIKTGVVNYIEKREWGFLEGLQKILRTSKHKDARGCWIEISQNLPSRPIKSIYERARRIYEGLVENYRRGKWLVDEVEELTRLQKLHGENWATIASLMDRSPEVCKDKWRHLKVAKTYLSGPWQQEELDKLCKLVREGRRMKGTVSPRKIDRREVRDDISWERISEEMSRDSSRCAETWYHRLASSMIPENKWTNDDDGLLLKNLLKLGAKSEKDVKWEDMIDDKEGDLCKKRWKEMTKRLDRKRVLSFKDKLELLAKRYAPELLGIEEQ